MPEHFTNENPNESLHEETPVNDSSFRETPLSDEQSTAVEAKIGSKKRLGSTRNLAGKMLFRRIRWWAWVYLWVALGFVVLSFVIVGGSTIAYLRDGRGFSSSIDVNDFLICRGFEWMLGMWVFIVGSCIASFLNVVAYRLPAGLPVTGHSFCPHCKVAIEKRDNLPILGWIHLQGRCRSCHIRISPRYPIFEAIGGLLMLSIFVSTILSHGANLPSVHQQVMPYGLPVNLRLMESIVFAFAFLHSWLLLILFTAALTHFAHGRLPVWVWVLGIAVSLTAIAFNPELVVLPIARPTEVISHDNSHIDDDGHRLISQQIAVTTVAIGMIVSTALGYATRLVQFNSPSNESPQVAISMWIGSCLMIGTVLGYQAAIGIVVMNIILRIAILAVNSSVSLIQFSSKPLEKFLAYGPLGTLWISTAIWLATWRSIHSALGILVRTVGF